MPWQMLRVRRLEHGRLVDLCQQVHLHQSRHVFLTCF